MNFSFFQAQVVQVTEVIQVAQVRQLIPESGEGREWRGAGGWLPPSVAREREAWRREPPFHATGLPPTDATVCSRSPNLPRSETKNLIFFSNFL